MTATEQPEDIAIAVGLQEFEHQKRRLYSVIDEDPVRAVQEARNLPACTSVGGVLFTGLKAGVFVDAGAEAHDKQAIKEGIELFVSLLDANPDDPMLHYNVANGYANLAAEVPHGSWDWYLKTAEIRREARARFQLAVVLDSENAVSSRALTNIGNALWNAHRWAEAYDAYSRALRKDPSNAIASTGAVKVLLRCRDHHIGDPQVLHRVAAAHLRLANQNPERIMELAGKRAYEDLSKLLKTDLPQIGEPDLTQMGDYERFVAKHRLALSPTIEGIDPSLKRWDSLQVSSITEPINTPHGVPAIFAMFNVMKGDFIAARYVAYEALSKQLPDSGYYSDTLDYAVYGLKSSMLCLAQRVCLDILDKIAVAVTEYFAIPGTVNNIYFSNRWFEGGKKGPSLVWHPALLPEIEAGNTALLALAELALDIRDGGSLSSKKRLRHSSTHRFTVVHDIGCNPSRESKAVEHCGIDELRSELIESLQLTRAAILYFVEAIAIAEVKRSKSGRLARIRIPSHHEIRGEEDTGA